MTNINVARHAHAGPEVDSSNAGHRFAREHTDLEGPLYALRVGGFQSRGCQPDQAPASSACNVSPSPPAAARSLSSARGALHRLQANPPGHSAKRIEIEHGTADQQWHNARRPGYIGDKRRAASRQKSPAE